MKPWKPDPALASPSVLDGDASRPQGRSSHPHETFAISPAHATSGRATETAPPRPLPKGEGTGPGDAPCRALRALTPVTVDRPTDGGQKPGLPGKVACLPKRPRGGPRTTEGKQRSRGNAMTHCMYAKTLLPEVLGTELLARRIRDLMAECDPQTPLETHYVTEMARHTVALERLGEAEGAVLRKGAAGAAALSQLFTFDGGMAGMDGRMGRSDEDIMLAGAVASNDLERVTRARRSHERGMKEAQGQFEELRQRRLATAGPAAMGALPPPADAAGVASEGAAQRLATTRFPDEDSCVAYLADWAQNQPFSCPRCGHDRASRIARQESARCQLQCRACRRQVSPRQGTVFACSPLPLRSWFLAIAFLFDCPNATGVEIAQAAGITRRKTARTLAEKVRAALESADRSRRLAGLDAVFLEAGIRPPPTFGASPVGPLDAEPVTGAVARPGAAPVTESPEMPPVPAFPGANLGQSVPANMVQA